MITIIQRVTMAKVTVNHQAIAEIDGQLKLLRATTQTDTLHFPTKGN